MSGKSKTSSPLIPLLAPGATLIALYAGYCLLFPSQKGKELVALVAQQQSLAAQEISPAIKAQVAADTKVANEQLTKATAELSALRADCGKLLQGRVGAIEQLQAKRRINHVLRAAGLTSIAQSQVENRQANLAKSLDDAAKQLSNTLETLASQEAGANQSNIPRDVPAGANPLEWMEEQRRLRSAKFDRASVETSELQLVGEFGAMLDALAYLQENCPEAIVTSIAFEKPERRTAATRQLIWKVRMQLQPVLDEEHADEGDVIAHRTAKVPVTVASSQRGD